MKAILSLADNNCAMRAWLKRADIGRSLKETLGKTVKAPWAARVKISGALEFLKGQIDYSKANPTESKGVVYRFVLDSENEYKCCTYKRGKSIIFYCKVDKNGEIIKT